MIVSQIDNSKAPLANEAHDLELPEPGVHGQAVGTAAGRGRRNIPGGTGCAPQNNGLVVSGTGHR